MPTVHFIGKIIPEIYKVTISHDVVLKWESPDIGLTMEFSNKIVDSQIDIECKLNRYMTTDFNPIYMRAIDICRTSVNLLAFSMGRGFSVIIDYFIDPYNIKSSIDSRDDSLPPLCTSYSITNGFSEIHKMVLTDWSLSHALNDLIDCLRQTHVSPVNCARAIERLKHLISPNITNEAKAWKKMRDVLQIDESYLKFITDYSANPRHGKSDYIPGNITTEITRRSWTIMNRYFEFRKRGILPLPINEFPLLK